MFEILWIIVVIMHLDGLRPLESESQGLIWKVDDTLTIGGFPTDILGAPRLVEVEDARAVRFDGVRDGLVVAASPMAGLAQFTIEILFMPEAGGLAEQRFFHVQDEGDSRALLEIRLTPEGNWALDTFLFSNKGSLALLDRAKVHPSGQWHWVALRYDGGRMAHFVNGEKELEGTVNFPPMKQHGKTSLGMRLNKVYWYKGAIREVRFSPTALSGDKLRRIP